MFVGLLLFVECLKPATIKNAITASVKNILGFISWVLADINIQFKCAVTEDISQNIFKIEESFLNAADMQTSQVWWRTCLPTEDIFLFAIGRRPWGNIMQANTCDGEKIHYMKVKNSFYKIRLQTGAIKTTQVIPKKFTFLI